MESDTKFRVFLNNLGSFSARQKRGRYQTISPDVVTVPPFKEGREYKGRYKARCPGHGVGAGVGEGGAGV